MEGIDTLVYIFNDPFLLDTSLSFPLWLPSTHVLFQTIRRGYFTMDLLISLSTNVTYFYSCLSLVYGYITANRNELALGQGLLMQNRGEGPLSYYSYSMHDFEIPHFFETAAIVTTAVLLGKVCVHDLTLGSPFVSHCC